MKSSALGAAGTRTPITAGLASAAARGRLELQVCAACAAVQYPPREACHRCLSDQLEWKPVPTGGKLLATTTLHHSNEPWFRERLPWRIALVQLDCGPSVVAHLHEAAVGAVMRVTIHLRLDKAGQGVLIALPEQNKAAIESDRRLADLLGAPAHDLAKAENP